MDMGISPELQEAIQRRQGQGGQPMQGQPQPTQTPPQPGFNPVTGGVEAQSQPSQGGGLPMQTPESLIIIKALDTRLKSISKQEEAVIEGSNLDVGNGMEQPVNQQF
jgi:hypothetical protein